MKKILLIVVIAAGVAALGYYVVLPMIFLGPKGYLGMLRYDQRQAGKLQVGQPAPDVELLGLDGKPVHLREQIGGQPVVLVFGSYT
jgi:hypothetical protein